MSRKILIDIGLNDPLPDVIRKCNDNFRRISAQESRSSQIAIRSEGERVDGEIASIMGQVSQAIESLRTEVAEAITGVRTWVEEKIAEVTQPKMFAPPIGTYLYCEQDPATTWSGTVWEKLGSGLYLVSADQAGLGNIGSNSVTLTTEQMPQHSHTGPSHTHTMAHTHAGPRHTHSVTGTAASAGAHTHKMLAPILRYASTQASNAYPLHVDSATKNWSDFIAPSAGAHTHSVTGTAAASGTGSTGSSSVGSTGSSGTGSTGTAGGSKAIDNRPLSVQVPLWKRTA